MNITTRLVTIEDYDAIYELWCSTEQSKRALNSVDDSRDGIAKYLNRNPTTCFLAEVKDGTGNGPELAGVILTGHDFVFVFVTECPETVFICNCFPFCI